MLVMLVFCVVSRGLVGCAQQRVDFHTLTLMQAE